MKWKTVRRILFGVVLGVFLFVAFLYWRFPEGLFKEITSARFSDACPGWTLAMQEMVPEVPPGLRFEKPAFRFGSPVEAAVMMETLSLFPDWWGLFSGWTTVAFQVQGYGGRGNGSVSNPGVLSLAGPMKGEMKFENVSLQRVSCLQYLLGRQLSGKLRGTVSYGQKGQGTGRLDFNILNGSYPLLDKAMGVDKLDFTQVEGQLLLTEKGIRIESISLNGEKVRCSLKGEIVIDAGNFRNSQISMTGQLELKALNNQKVAFTVTGTFTNPVTKIG